ncbi:hypothetical protein IWQ55_006185 [Labrenzia sp. EL_208]|nr:hypothetical protein [Labrenzia sp. EL_132]MBG6211549.1 hypothetical protein [Labrenzia sp. EL_126]MBG6232951.1 hypothetical protein [Labrenzia sp. EL_208]
MFNFLQHLSDNSETIGLTLRHTGSALDIARKVQDLVSKSKKAGDPKLERLVASLIKEITDAELANVELKKSLIELQNAALEAERVQDKLGRYELWQTPAGSSVYRLKADCADGEHTHYCCPVCFQDAKISILQGGKTVKRCMVCEKNSRTYLFEPKEPFDWAELSRKMNG